MARIGGFALSACLAALALAASILGAAIAASVNCEAGIVILRVSGCCRVTPARRRRGRGSGASSALIAVIAVVDSDVTADDGHRPVTHV
jgi:hypothetical protein